MNKLILLNIKRCKKLLDENNNYVNKTDEAIQILDDLIEALEEKSEVTENGKNKTNKKK